MISCIYELFYPHPAKPTFYLFLTHFTVFGVSGLLGGLLLLKPSLQFWSCTPCSSLLPLPTTPSEAMHTNCLQISYPARTRKSCQARWFRVANQESLSAPKSRDSLRLRQRFLPLPEKSRLFEAPRCLISSAKKIASEPRFFLR